MKQIFLLTSCILLASAGVGQDNNSTLKRQLRFSIGPEYRITPIYDIFAESYDVSELTHIENQNSGLGLNLGLEYFITKKLSIEFDNTLRYDLILSHVQGVSSYPETQKVDYGTYGILQDYHFSIAYYFKAFRNGDFFVSYGYSLMNQNSDYTLTESRFDEDEKFLSASVSTGQFSYNANRICVGFRKQNVKTYLGFHISKVSDYLIENKPFIVPHFGFSYDLLKLW